MSSAWSLRLLWGKVAVLGAAIGILLAAHPAVASRGTGGGRPQGRCPDGYTNCRGYCVLLSDDENNCGACALVCPGGWNCTNGACCPTSGQTNCNGACIDTSSDPTNCGGCGVRCGYAEQCVAGQCSCANGAACPGGSACCPDYPGCLSTCVPGYYIDAATCGSVTACPEGSTPCVSTTTLVCGGAPAGVCCPSGTTCDDGSCRQ
jgi:hypothetical protein